MADLVITGANIDDVSGPTKTLDAAEALTPGLVVYQATSTTLGIATNNDATKDEVVGITVNTAAAGQPATYCENGATVAFGAILTVGVWYVLSASGAISPITDSATNDYVSVIGYALTTSNMKLHIVNTGLQQG